MPAETLQRSREKTGASAGASSGPLADGKIEQASEAAIHLLVDRFYDKVRADAALGQIFARAIPGDWGPHLATMRDFWSSIMLTSGRYHGNPVAVHGRLDGMEPQLFARWLALFSETCAELFVPELEAAFMEKARRIAESLKMALFYRPDRPCPGSAP